MNIEGCTFCDITAGRIHSQMPYEDDEFVVFRNKLKWAPVMLLVVPRSHMTQTELWGSGQTMAHIARLARQIGDNYSPNGYRILSNFGPDGLQTQEHAHLHVIGGAHLGHYIRPPDRK